MHLLDRHHVAILAVEATEECQDHLTITNRVAEVAERRGHGLQSVAIIGDAHRSLAQVAKLRLEEERAGFAIAEKLIHQEAPSVAGGELVKR